MKQFFFPFLTWLGLVNFNTFKADFFAGLTGAVVVLPQGVAFAAIAGLPPEYGLYTAMVTPIIAGLFGSSLHLVSGPTTAISLVVFSTISRYAEPGSEQFIQMVLTLTFLAGVYQLVFGLMRLGMLVNFVSHTVVIGFTAGAAILIATSQIKYVTGIPIPKGESFLHTWVDVGVGIGAINLYILAIAGFTMLSALLLKRFLPKMPHLLFGMVMGSLASIAIGGAAHGLTYVGEIKGQLPPLSMPDLSLSSLKQLASGAFAVALLGLIEAVSIARSIATKSQQRLDGNQEFVGQGLSNIAGSFLSSYAGSGSFTRSGINYSAGARTPLSAVFAAILLAIIVLLVAPLAAYLPVAAMGGIIMLVAYNLIDFHHIKHILHSSKTETSILATTFFATLFMELEFAIYMGVLLSLIIFLMRTSMPNIVDLAPNPAEPRHKFAEVSEYGLKECPQLKLVRVDMSIYFGSLDKVQRELACIAERQHIKHVLIVGDSINFIDLAGAEMLLQEAKRLKSLGGGLYLQGAKNKVYDFMDRIDFVEEFGQGNVFSSKEAALKSLTKRLDHSICATCDKRIFHECAKLPGAKTA
ncbi:SulP family inorganic anion transporter [Thiothrix fructosivorans]|uniref:SulP family inorganic anion transporter n=1 Tax=Thiothrix fructosivorans TaxID=111770 RepID=A0A8B0SHG1_9GAMM|nr:SulP family inorganic anion transporter [Thiothrix fructosivorans]MBO0613779.1 SulP family inorganic anion transporter [Thiothrix fructosivorans]QTX10806.1 SulP family inorganic anion transporter [Thiothrix fructosivorans]QTX10813.1 SulP family inorganic anion transporter [Thiothrix fructosivorans]